ncbi:methyltransferase domain-containing protein [Paenibacillus tritici]|nr:methyltransferase domain-containing protein [Paenibacillus tritici]
MFIKRKRVISAERIEKFQEIFICPLCKKQMQLVDLKSLVCENQHCFDIAKCGYLNLSSRASNTKYDQKIFDNRRAVSQSGLFNPLHAVISEIMMSELQSDEPLSILDAGCGEGSHLNRIQVEMQKKKSNPLLAVGIDISKEGISSAAAEYSNAIWCVADIANCPFANQQFNYIVNILSPANYSEFKRMIMDQGMVIKVVPEQDHLKEIREVLHEGSNKQVYSNGPIINYFNKQFKLLDIVSIRYPASLNESLIDPLLGMTPLSWGVSSYRKKKIQKMNLKQVTMDFKILIGKKQ